MPYIIIKLLKGRSFEQKQDLARRIADATIDTLGVDRKTITVRFEESDPENLAPGGELGGRPSPTSS